MRPPVKWHGGKRYLAQRIISYFPAHRIYLEPFGGGASVLLNKPLAEVETYNDLDHRITRLFRVLRDHGQEFLSKVQLTPYSQIEFDESANFPENEIGRASCRERGYIAVDGDMVKEQQYGTNGVVG